jgi:hypothetical protein
MNTYRELTGRSMVDHSNNVAAIANEFYLQGDCLKLAYECNDGAVATLVFEYKGEEI